MITEVAIFNALPGKDDELGQAILHGLDSIRKHPGCISSQVQRCIEQPSQYILTNVWISLDSHMQDFRSSALFTEWRGHIKGLFEENPTVFHTQPF
jgi:quinol monooxygenase YgiN